MEVSPVNLHKEETEENKAIVQQDSETAAETVTTASDEKHAVEAGDEVNQEPAVDNDGNDKDNQSDNEQNQNKLLLPMSPMSRNLPMKLFRSYLQMQLQQLTINCQVPVILKAKTMTQKVLLLIAILRKTLNLMIILKFKRIKTILIMNPNSKRTQNVNHQPLQIFL